MKLGGDRSNEVEERETRVMVDEILSDKESLSSLVTFLPSNRSQSDRDNC